MNRLQSDIRKFLTEGPIGIYLMAFLIPLNPRFLGMAVAVIIVEQLIRSPKINKIHLNSQLSWRNPGIWLLCFYLMHFVGLINTENMGFASMDLGMKSTLGILPIFFMLYQLKVDWSVFVKVFIAGAFISIIANILISIGLYLEIRKFYVLLGEYLSHFMHRGYWSVYLVTAYFFLLKQMIETTSKKSFWANFLGALIMLTFVVLSGAKVGMIILFFISVWASISLFKRFNNKWILPIATAVMIAAITIVVYAVPSIANRMTTAMNAVNQPIENFDKENPESTAARLMLWDSSIQLIKENFWFGVGTGDIKDELIQRNIENGYSGVAKKKLNSHNQLFNTHIALGVFGSLFLLLAFGMNFLKFKPDEIRGWRFGIIAILFLALLPESMLERQAGIIPYAFFICFLPSFKLKKLF